MLAFFKVIGWSLIGSLIACVLMFAGMLVYFRVFEPSAASDIRSWQDFGAMMGSLGSAAVGFVLGAVYGIVRARKSTVTTN